MTTTSADLVIVRLTLVSGEPLFLDPFEQDLGQRIGEEQHRVDQARGCKARVIQDPFATRSNHRAGAMAEIAVARKLNLCPQWQFKEYRGWNLRLAGGDLVAVQWDPRHRRCVVDKQREADHRKKRKDLPDLHIILTGELPHFVFAGWVTHAEALAGQDDDLGYGPCWVQTMLHERLEILTCARGSGYR